MSKNLINALLKLDIIMSRWDEKDPLIDKWHDPEQKVNMGKREQCFFFSTECCRSMLASRMIRVTGWPVSSWVPWQENCVERTKKEESGRAATCKQDEETSYLCHGLKQGAPTWCQFEDNYKWWPMRQRDCYSVFNKISSETLFLAIQANSPIAVKAFVPYLYAILLDNFKS